MFFHILFRFSSFREIWNNRFRPTDISNCHNIRHSVLQKNPTVSTQNNFSLFSISSISFPVKVPSSGKFSMLCPIVQWREFSHCIPRLSNAGNISCRDPVIRDSTDKRRSRRGRKLLISENGAEISRPANLRLRHRSPVNFHSLVRDRSRDIRAN